MSTDKPYRDGPHKEPKTRDSYLKGASAGLLRKATMLSCNCRLCYLTLNPPLTFAMYESFGLNKIDKEAKQATHSPWHPFK